jgi:hypothetical protein
VKDPAAGAERHRLDENEQRERDWTRWAPTWRRGSGAPCEDYSRDGSCWEYFPHDQARSRAFRWGEDGLLGITEGSAACASPSPSGTGATPS